MKIRLTEQNRKWLIVTTKAYKINIQISIDTLIINNAIQSNDPSNRPDRSTKNNVNQILITYASAL